jgi:hypothetical protein
MSELKNEFCWSKTSDEVFKNPPTEKVALKIMKKAWVLLFEKKEELSTGVCRKHKQ